MPILSSNPRVTVNILEILLGHYYISPACGRHAQLCHYATKSRSNIEGKATDIAVLGGGITGLASAYYLSRLLPDAKITLFEASTRLGGWLHSKQVNVGNGKVVFEQGPRNLRPTNPNGLVTLDLVHDLGLEDRVLMTSKNSVAARNRFVYYPDHLVRMPGPGTSLLSNITNLLSEPVFKGAIWSAIKEYYGAAPKRPEGVEDESIGSFITRRFGSGPADNLTSAIIHGIYAGDIYNLSARTILPAQWETETKIGSVLQGFYLQQQPVYSGEQTSGDDSSKYLQSSGRRPVATDDVELIKDFNSRPAISDRLKAIRTSSVFTFKGGIGELADRLEAKLLKNRSVVIQMHARVRKLELRSQETGSKIRLTVEDIPSKETRALDFTHIISTIAGSNLASISGSDGHSGLSSLRKTKSVTVMVVNLYFSNPAILPVHGFGYLIPRTVSFEQNPERALGVVFDSDATIGQDEVPGTKVTVMLGGHWWDGWAAYPDEKEGANMAKTILQRHLGISEEPHAIRVSLQRDCIPQYPVGHQKNMEDASRQLKTIFQGRLRVAGNSYTGVGLNDCVRAARDVVQGLVNGKGETGLESFLGGKKYSWVTKKELNEV